MSYLNELQRRLSSLCLQFSVVVLRKPDPHIQTRLRRYASSSIRLSYLHLSRKGAIGRRILR